VRPLRILDERARARAHAAVAARLGDGRSAAELVAAAAEAGALLDAAAERARGGEAAPACAAGCAFCCHVHVDATVPEILAAAAFVRRTLPEEAQAALRERLAAQARRVAGMDDEARWAARVPCALLDEGGRCSVYEARPLRCRAFHSTAVEPCREAFAGRGDGEAVPDATLARTAAAIEEGYDRALAGRGVAAEGLRFEIGLAIALEDGGASERQRAGEDVFAAARTR
jgi:Fe-S-cluster containining protein